jgi:hypothetical protein
MKTWKRMRSCLLLAVLGIVVCLGFSFVVLSSAVARLPDYGKLPPRQVFKMILGYEPPVGISNLRAEGREALYGQTTAWLTFQFTDTALAAMLKHGPSGSKSDGEPMTGEWAVETIRQISGSYSRREAERMRRVGWDAVTDISRPELYFFPAEVENPSPTWGGWLIIDRPRKHAFIRALK